MDLGRSKLVNYTQFTGETVHQDKKDKSNGSDPRCLAMRNKQPWSFDNDTYTLLCNAYLLLEGKELGTGDNGDGEHIPTKWMSARSGWRITHNKIWKSLFDKLLNEKDGYKHPLILEDVLIPEFEKYFTDHDKKQVQHQFIKHSKKMTTFLKEKRKK